MSIAFDAAPLGVPITELAAANPAVSRRRRVSLLVVEDDRSVRTLLGRALAGDGVEVSEAPNAAEAERLVAESCPDLVVADVVMPGRSGIELRRELMNLYPKLPVVLISGYSPEQVAEFAARTPATSFLPKPFSIAALQQTVNEALEARARSADRGVSAEGSG
jgi:DNA-binding NtrC family response regulator